MKWKDVQPHIQSVESFSLYIGINKDKLFKLCRSASRFYVRDEKAENGKIRVFYKPRGELKVVQKFIHKKILIYAPSHRAIHGYRKKRSQITAAMPHIGKEMLVTADIRDFFPSVKPKQIHDALMAIGFAHPVARIVTQLCTHEDQLPQGAPTSPLLANQLWLRPANRVQGFSNKHGFEQSIIGDDLFVSGERRAEKYRGLMKRIITEEGFTVHPRKTKAVSNRSRQVAAGLVVNKKLNVPKSYKRALRAEIHTVVSRNLGSNERKSRKLSSIEGKIGYVRQSNPSHAAAYQQKFNQATREKEGQ